VTLATPVALVEDIRLLREGMARMLHARGIRVIATARSSADALRQVERLKPPLVLLSAELEDHGSVRLVEAIKRVAPEVSVVVMDVRPAEDNPVEFVRAGASGFIVRDASIDNVVRSLEAVAGGTCVLPRSLTTQLFAHVASGGPGRRGPPPPRSRLTLRERQVAELIGEGLANKEIAGRLHITVHTVKSHVHNILDKLDLHTRLEIATHVAGREETM
jgi:DNA-binding NarL/FixJ family response regulator